MRESDEESTLVFFVQKNGTAVRNVSVMVSSLSDSTTGTIIMQGQNLVGIQCLKFSSHCLQNF